MENWIDFNGDTRSLILNSKVTLSRNFEKNSFPTKMNSLECKKIVNNVYCTINNNFQNQDFQLVDLSTEDPYKIDEYLRKQIITENSLRNREKTSIIVNEDETLSIILNEQDNVKIQIATAGLNFEEIYNNADNIDNIIERDYSYAFDSKLGYLTASANDVGTGMHISALMHLPCIVLNKKTSEIKNSLVRKGIIFRSKYQKDNKPYGDLFEISNRYTLGIKENDIIGNLKESIIEILALEQTMREELFLKTKYELQDKIMRAYAVLSSAIMLEEEETVKLLSAVRFGVEVSLLDIDKSKINKILLSTDDKSVQSNFDEKLDKRRMNYERAQIVKKMLI
ncbi:ATP--guanido phosphotransferase [Clostridium sp. BJN0001]|uniref:ATP--guanido phosphotransferase n=1 Tax=Clostridium sp. BJN0001 TaxID=2930219 RepID=UPI001FD3C783|nr:ATP--guanido phosphotransferase [Clostridium sp. BJN0001]